MSVSDLNDGDAQPQRVKLAEVKPGDMVEKLARRLAVPERAVERFRVLNGLGEKDRLKPGDLVKIVWNREPRRTVFYAFESMGYSPSYVRYGADRSPRLCHHKRSGFLRLIARPRSKPRLERAVANAQSPNRLLASLSPADLELVRPHLKTIDLIHGTVLFESGQPVSRVYFPHSGIISLVVDLASGEMIEAAMIGRDSVVGGSSALGNRHTMNKGIVQTPGAASILDAEQLRKAADASVSFRTMLIRHEQALFFQAQQSAACNASHALEARLARWLLRSRELSGGDTMQLTQEFLGQMLGVRRTSVSLVAHTLQQAGLIAYRRGRINVTDLPGLQEAACECYGTVKSHYDHLHNGGQAAGD